MASRIINRSVRVGGVTAASLISLSSVVPTVIRSSAVSSAASSASSSSTTVVTTSSILSNLFSRSNRVQYFGTTAGATSTDYIMLDETSQNVDDIIKKNSKVLAYYTAAWCNPCRMIAPHFASLAASNKSKVTFVKIDIDECPEAAEKGDIRAVPTFKALHNGKVVREFKGMDLESLKNTVEHLANLQ